MNHSILFGSSLNTHFLPGFMRGISHSTRFICYLSGSNFNLNKQNISNYSRNWFLDNKYLFNMKAEPIHNLEKLNVNYNRYSTGQEKRVTWDDHEDIAELLFQHFRDTNPLSLRFTDLHEMVEKVVRNNYFCEISGECSEGALEKIQMTWLELYEQD